MGNPTYSLCPSSSQPNGCDASVETLHIVFHGTFLFNFCPGWLLGEKEGVEVLAPIVPNHVFRIGNWLGEVDLSRHDSAMVPTYELFGVDAGDATMNSDQNLVFDEKVRLKSPDLLDPLLAARIRLPRPRLIRSPRRTKVDRDDFSHPEKLPPRQNGYELSTLQILTYSFKNEIELMIRQLSTTTNGHGQPVLWEPAFSGSSFNLHIFSAPEQDRPASHVSSAFNQLIGLFADLDGLALDRYSELSRLRLDELNSEPGVSEEETEDLAPRRRRLSQLGRMRKEQRDLNLLWFESEAFDSSPDSCASAGRKG